MSSSGSKLPFVLGFAALLLLTFAFGLRFMWFYAETPLPALLRGLGDSKTEADQQDYVSRLKQAFPDGTEESRLVATLREQGFRLSAAPERAAAFDRQAGLNDKCRRSGNVRWNAGADGRVSAVTGGYYQHCPSH